MTEPTGAFMPDPRVVELQQTIRELQTEVERLQGQLADVLRQRDEGTAALLDENARHGATALRLATVVEALKMLEFDGDGDEAHVVGWPSQETVRTALAPTQPEEE